jgi:hypothetical protein
LQQTVCRGRKRFAANGLSWPQTVCSKRFVVAASGLQQTVCRGGKRFAANGLCRRPQGLQQTVCRGGKRFAANP